MVMMMDEDWVSAIVTVAVLLGIALLIMIILSVYFLAMIWAINYLFRTNIGYFDLWAWLAIFVVTFTVKFR